MNRTNLSVINPAKYFARQAKETSVEPHMLEARRAAVAAAFSQWMGESLAPVALGFAWLYLFFGFAHLLILPPPTAWFMSTTAFGTTVLMMAFQARWRQTQLEGQWAHAGAALIAGLIGLNSSLHLFLTNDVLQSSNLLLLVVGVGFFFLSSAWLAGALVAIYGCWGLAILTIEAANGQWTHFTFGLLSASVLAVSAHVARKRALRRVAFLRLQDRERTKQLQDALTAEQAVEEALRQSETRYRLLYDEVEQRAQELHRVNTRLAQAVRVKDEFLASVSHELRTPLTAILGLTETLQEDIYGPLTEQQQGVLRNIDQSGRHLLALITDILDVAKIEAGQFTLELGPAAVDAVCQASLMLIKQKAQRKQIQITTELDVTVKIIETDDRRLKQILVNLLDNAIKFTPEGGTVGLEVKGDPENKIVHFSVWDTGIGIAPVDFPRLFKPFVQLDSRLARQYAGSGLGLVLVYRMAEMQGGSVTVASNGHGGSRFTISLPWRVPKTGTPPAAVESATAAQSTSDWPLVLIADDHALVTTALTKCLSICGMRAVVAQTAAEVIEKAVALQPALLLVDMQLPTLEGDAILSALRNEVRLQTTPIIAMSAIHWLGCESHYLAAGASAYLCKPVSAQQLQVFLQQWVPIAKDFTQ